MIPQVRKPKSLNIAPNPLIVILNNLHYEQRNINRQDNTTLSLDMDDLDVLPKFLAYQSSMSIPPLSNSKV